MKSKEDILEKIIHEKKKILEEKKLLVDILFLQEKISQGAAPVLRPFRQALQDKIQQEGMAIIAELKKASPSKGLLCPNYDPSILASQYEQHGAACLSVLTEVSFFLGCDHDLETARLNCKPPVLRKDFIIDTYQIYESRVLGADCILLIAAILSKSELQEYYTLATQLGLEVLIEVTNEKELNTALEIQPTLIGINNRNLRDFSVDLDHTLFLRKQIPEETLVICESGIKKRSDIEHMLDNGIQAFLIGETLVTAKAPGLKLGELLGKKS